MTQPPEPTADQIARAQRLRDQIGRLEQGAPAAPKTPRELTDEAARKAAEQQDKPD
jgi:hypothetical protein